jgi:hypothetical protein
MDGGGRTYNAKIARRCFAELGCARSSTTRRKIGLGAGDEFVGEAECAAMQTWQVVDSS